MDLGEPSCSLGCELQRPALKRGTGRESSWEAPACKEEPGDLNGIVLQDGFGVRSVVDNRQDAALPSWLGLLQGVLQSETWSSGSVFWWRL